MIFVTVGSQKFQMNRLLQAVDTLIEQGALSGDVLAQSGACTYQPRHFRAEAFIDRDMMHEYIRSCALMICHAGASSILTGVKAGRRVIVLPRRAALGEHVDDHQFELATAFEAGGHVLVARDENELAACVQKAEGFSPVPYVSNTETIARIVLEAIEG